MSKISKRTIENLREFMDRGCEYAGTQEIVNDLVYEALRESSGADACTDIDDVSLNDYDDEFLVSLEEFANIFWDKAVEKILNVLETEN